MTIRKSPARIRLDKSRQQEKRVAEMFGVKRHAGSGSGRYWKNDGHTEKELWECKRTDGERKITIDVLELEALCRRATAQGLRPVEHIEISGRGYVVLTEQDYYDLRRGDV